MKKLFLWVLMAGSNFWANAQVQVVVVRYFEEITVNYKYNAGTNQLQYITDNVLNTVSTTDIDNQNPNNYIYDKSGNMVADNSQSMSVSWSPYGKILTNTKAGGASLAFGYNAMQQRVVKRVVIAGDTTRTYYIRDAQGNTMGVYTRHNDSVTWREQYIFGSSRLGLYRADTLVNKGLTVISKLYEGKRNYELTNHLGNVMAVINDRKVDTLSGTTKIGFNAVVISATDYYPFGMAIDSRSYTSSLYRYSFNGKETDKETGEQDYGMRIYDRRNPTFLSVDPIGKKFREYSPYIFAGDNPIRNIDLDGLEPLSMITNTGRLTKPVISLLESTFGYSVGSMEKTTWDNYKNSSWGKSWFLLTRYPNASVLNKTIFYDGDNLKNDSDKKWLTLISHEQSHRDEMDDLGSATVFYGSYVTQGVTKKYENINTEHLAFQNEDFMDDLLSQKPIILDIINDKTMGDLEKSKQLSKIGKEFRSNTILPTLIKKADQKISELNERLKSKGASKEVIKMGIEIYKREKKDFESEKSLLDKTLKENKK